MLSAAPNKRAMVLGLFVAFAAFAFVSLSVGEVVKVGNVGHVTAVSGLTTSKNDEAASMATGFLVSFLFLAMGIQTRSLLQCAIAGFVGLVEIFGTVMARSSGALAAAGVALTAFIVFIWLRRAHSRTRLTVVGFVCATALFAGVVFLAFHHDVLEWLSSAFNKDMTLTGRTYLWQRAQEMALERPIGGRGFAAFWQQGNLDAEGLWQFAHIKSRFGFNFHSTYYDILIGMGWIGLIAFAITLALGAGRAALAYVRMPALLSCFWLAIAVYVIVRMPIETVGTYEFDFTTVLLFAMFGSGVRSKRLDTRLRPGTSYAGGLPILPEHAFQPRPYGPAE
jgi:exopolysaccharide production protein ExoQ